MQFLSVVPGTDEWKQVRRKYITGTDIAPLMLKREFCPHWMHTKAEVYLDKLGELPPEPENAYMRRGRAMEAPAAKRYENSRSGFYVYTCPMIVDGIFAANIDRIVGMPGAPACTDDGQQIIAKRIAEIKTSSKAWGENYPMYYYGQPQWYMGFLKECESADLVCWFDAGVNNIKEDEEHEDFAVYNIPKNQAFIDAARQVATEFMEKNVKERIFPEVETEAECRIKWAVSKAADSVTATKEVLAALREIHRIDEEKEQLEADRGKQVMKVMELMGDHPLLVNEYGETIVSWKSSKARRTVKWRELYEDKFDKLKDWLEQEGILAAVPEDIQKVTDKQIEDFTDVAEKGSRPFKIIEQKA